MSPEENNFRRDLAKWVNNFQEKREQRKIRDEEDVKNGIIDPLLEIFGWDVNNPSKVKKEERIGSRFADYALKVDEKTKVIIEAKALDKKLSNPESSSLSEYEKQAINYAYNKGINWAILTNGEEWRLYNAYWKGEKLAFKVEIGEFPREEEFPKISLLRQEKVAAGEIDDYFEERPERPDVDEEVTQVLLDARADITESVVELNPDRDTEEMRDGIQTTLDRLLFMKICEDRDITEHGQLKHVKDMVEGDPADETTLSDALQTFAFTRFRKVYDGGLFEPQIADELSIANQPLRDLIETLYIYDFSSIDVDVLGHIYEDYLENVLMKLEEGGLEWITDNTERKEHGQFYTPQYIVDYIIENTGIDKDSKVLDPACGSGAFLIKAFDKLKELHIEEQKNDEEETEVENGFLTLSNFLDKETEKDINKSILTENIHGVDLNEEAVELTRINLWLRSIQKDTELNKLDHNIKTGNSLISGAQEELEEYFDNPEEKNPFNWKEEFPEVLEGEEGFDAIIGNPPYVRTRNLPSEDVDYLRDHYETARHKFDIYITFIERAVELLKPGGKLGFIVSNKFMGARYGKALRGYLLENTVIEQIVDVSNIDVFDADTYPILLIVGKPENEDPLENNIEIITDIETSEEIVEGDISGFEIPQKVFYNEPDFVFSLKLDQTRRDLISKIRSQRESLGSKLDVREGIHTGNVRSKLILDEEGENCEKLLGADEVDNYHIHWSGKWIKYDQSILDEEGAYGSLREERIFDCNEKVVMRDIDKTPTAAYDDQQFYLLNTLYSVVKEEEYGDSTLKPVAGLLNSSLFHFYFKTLFSSVHVREGYLRFKPQYTETFPFESGIKSDKRLIQNVDELTQDKDKLSVLSTEPGVVIDKYTSNSGYNIGNIIQNSDFVNEIETGSSATPKTLQIKLDDDIITISAEVYDGWREVVKFQLEDEEKQLYLKLYLESLEEAGLGELEGTLVEKIESIEIPDWDNEQVYQKVVDEWRARKEEKRELEEEIRENDQTIDAIVFNLYDLTEEEVETVLDSLDTEEEEKKAIMEKFRDINERGS